MVSLSTTRPWISLGISRHQPIKRGDMNMLMTAFSDWSDDAAAQPNLLKIVNIYNII
jgi:hypothetical protein